MYLSALLIDVGSNPDRPRPGRLWLRNLYHVHQRLCMAFPSDQRKQRDPAFLMPYAADDFPEQRYFADKKKTEVGPQTLAHVHRQRGPDSGFLFRIDPQPSNRVVILVQSSIKPDWDYAFHNACYFLAAPPEVTPFEFHFAKDQHLQFRLMANPTRKIDTKSGHDGSRRNGKRVPVLTNQFDEWLSHRAEHAGFRFNKDNITVLPGYVYVRKPPRDSDKQFLDAHLRSVRYDGILKITDPTQFRETLIHGIGPAKAYGFGLMSIAPVHHENV